MFWQQGRAEPWGSQHQSPLLEDCNTPTLQLYLQYLRIYIKNLIFTNFISVSQTTELLTFSMLDLV